MAADRDQLRAERDEARRELRDLRREMAPLRAELAVLRRAARLGALASAALTPDDLPDRAERDLATCLQLWALDAAPTDTPGSTR